MNALQALVKPILEYSENYKWQLQGFGMLRTYLTKDIRLHIWDPSLQSEGVSLIHDHPWDFRSNIIVGSLTNIVYTPRAKSADYPFPTHYLQRIVCGPGGGAMPTTTDLERFSLPILRRSKYAQGAEYSQNADLIHETEAEPGTVTLVTRFSTEKHPDHASVYVPLGMPWGSAEPRVAIRSEIESFTAKALARYNEIE